MNLRILKKKSKRAAQYLPLFGEYDIFFAERGENYHGLSITCKHRKKLRWKFSTDNHEMYCPRCEDHPLKGTPMVGERSGYYEPEWEERTAYEELQKLMLYEAIQDNVDTATRQLIMKSCDVTEQDIEAIKNWISKSGCALDMFDETTQQPKDTE